MPAYTTAQPIRVDLDLAVGDARITAEERSDTVVEVRPRDPEHAPDVRAAEQTQVTFDKGRLEVRTPRVGLTRTRGWSIEVVASVPEGSTLTGHTGLGDLVVEGALAACSYKTGAGRLRLDRTGELHLTSGIGDISVDDVAGSAAISTGTGVLEIGTISGSAAIKSGNGAIAVERIDGDARVRTARGDIAIGTAGGSLDAKTATGDVRVGSVSRGSIGLNTAIGDVEVGIAAGTAAQLDLRTRFGRVDQQLEPADGPASGAQVAKVRGRTATGDVRVRRAAALA